MCAQNLVTNFDSSLERQNDTNRKKTLTGSGTDSIARQDFSQNVVEEVDIRGNRSGNCNACGQMRQKRYSHVPTCEREQERMPMRSNESK